MKPQLGDTVIGRYTLVSSLRESDGLSAWIANDRMLAQSCQLFIITDTSVLPQINEAASTLALANSRYCTPVLQLQHVGDAAVVITEPDSGLALTEYMKRSSSSFLSYVAIRSIVGQCTQAVQELLDTGLTHTALSTDTIRVSVNGVQFADTPVAAALADICSGIDGDVMSYEQMATRQLAALLYALLTKTPSGANTTFDLNMLPADVPTEFRVICKRGLALHTEDGEIIVPMATLAELSALLGAWEPFSNLSDRDIILPSVSGSARSAWWRCVTRAMTRSWNCRMGWLPRRSCRNCRFPRRDWQPAPRPGSSTSSVSHSRRSWLSCPEIHPRPISRSSPKRNCSNRIPPSRRRPWPPCNRGRSAYGLLAQGRGAGVAGDDIHCGRDRD